MRSPSERLFDLIDPDYIGRVIESIRGWIEYPEHHTPQNCANIIRQDFVEPLDYLLDGEWERGGWGKKPEGRWRGAMEHVLNFQEAANDLVYELELSPPGYGVMASCVGILEMHWREFQRHWSGHIMFKDRQTKAAIVRGQELANEVDPEHKRICDCYLEVVKDKRIAAEIAISKGIEPRVPKDTEIFKILKDKPYNVTLERTQLYEIINKEIKPEERVKEVFKRLLSTHK